MVATASSWFVACIVLLEGLTLTARGSERSGSGLEGDRLARPDMPVAARAWDEFRGKAPFDVRKRDALAQLYRLSGFISVAKFVDQTATNALGKPASGKLVLEGNNWGCAEGPGNVLARDKQSRAIQSLVSRGEVLEAKARADEATQRFPGSCILTLRWSEVTLLTAIAAPGRVNSRDREIAVRAAISAGGSPMLSSLWDDGAPAIYELLAQYFSSVEDYDSAHTAAEISKALFKECVSFPRQDCALGEGRVTKLIGAIENKRHERALPPTR